MGNARTGDKKITVLRGSKPIFSTCCSQCVLVVIACGYLSWSQYITQSKEIFPILYRGGTERKSRYQRELAVELGVQPGSRKKSLYSVLSKKTILSPFTYAFPFFLTGCLTCFSFCVSFALLLFSRNQKLG